jgi:hypothetical protein
MKRLAFYAVAALAVILVMGWLAWSFDPFGRRKAAETRASNAEAQSKVDTASAKVLDRYHTQTIVIREKAANAERSIRQAPTADQPLDPGLRDALCAGLASLRDGDPACSDTDDLR